MVLRLHLGAHKTATTHLQESLRAARPALLERGLFYLGPNAMRSPRWDLFEVLREYRPDSPETRRFVTSFAYAQAEGRDVTISEENLLSTTHPTPLFGAGRIYHGGPARLSMMLTLLNVWEVELYFAVRDPAAFITSAFSEQVMSGRQILLEDYLGGFDPAAISWAGLLADMLALNRVRSITVWRFEDYRELRPQILDRLLGAGRGDVVPDPAPHREGLSEPGYRHFLDLAMAEPDEDLRRLANRARDAFPKSQHPSLRPFSDEVYARSAVRYQEDLAEIAALEGVTLLGAPPAKTSRRAE